MTPDFNLCDICEDPCSTSNRIYVVTGKHMDAAGSMDTEGTLVDICGDCSFKALNIFLHKNINNGEKFLEYIRIKAKKD